MARSIRAGGLLTGPGHRPRRRVLPQLPVPAPLPSRPTRAGCIIISSRPGAGPSAIAPYACRVHYHLQSPGRRPLCRRAPRDVGCSVVLGLPGAGPSAVAPHACRVRCRLWSPRRRPLCRHTPRVQGAVSSLVAVSGQQCSQEFLLTQPTSPGPPSLERGAGLQPGRRPGFSASWQGHAIPAQAAGEK